MNLDELNEFSNQFLAQNYSLTLDIPIVINNRLKVTVGAVVLVEDEPQEIELAGYLMRYGSERFILDVLKHELIHYALNLLGKPYHDGDKYFENELKRLGVTASGVGRIGRYLKFICPACKEVGYTEKKRAMEHPDKFSTICCKQTLEPISYVICDGETETEEVK